MYAYRPAHLLLATVACVLSSAPVLAIDAGSQLRRFQDETQQRTQTRRPGIDPIPQWPASPSQAAAASKVQTHVSGFEMDGVTRFSGAEVAAVLKDYIGRNLTTAEIHAAANRLMRRYRNGGY